MPMLFLNIGIISFKTLKLERKNKVNEHPIFKNAWIR
jgi:hypothetical protein